MITNTISLPSLPPFDWPIVVQAIAAFGTVAAVIVSLWLAWRNREQFRMTTRLNVLPTLIEQVESAARQLENNGLFLHAGYEWNPPAEVHALKLALRNLENMKVEDVKTFTYVVSRSADAFSTSTKTQSETAQNRIATHKLLVPVVRKLIELREEFEQLADKTRTT